MAITATHPPGVSHATEWIVWVVLALLAAVAVLYAFGADIGAISLTGVEDANFAA